MIKVLGIQLYICQNIQTVQLRKEVHHFCSTRTVNVLCSKSNSIILVLSDPNPQPLKVIIYLSPLYCSQGMGVIMCEISFDRVWWCFMAHDEEEKKIHLINDQEQEIATCSSAAHQGHSVVNTLGLYANNNQQMRATLTCVIFKNIRYCVFIFLLGWFLSAVYRHEILNDLISWFLRH